MADLKVDTGTSIAVGASVNLLGFDMNAMLAVEAGENVKALVLPGITDSPQEVLLSEMLSSIGKTLNTTIDSSGLDRALAYVGLESSKTLVRLHQAFALYDSSGTGGKALEYAFSVSIVNKVDESAQKGIFTIQSLSFAIWNSTRESVISKMALGSIEEILAKMDNPSLASGNRQLTEGK